MNKIIEALYKSEFPKLNVKINKFKHKKTGEIGFCVMGVNNHMYVYNASEWEMLDKFEVEGTERIQEVLHEEMLKQLEEKKEVLHDLDKR